MFRSDRGNDYREVVRVIRGLRVLLTVTATAVLLGVGLQAPANAAIPAGESTVQAAACGGVVIPPGKAFGYFHGCMRAGTRFEACSSWSENFVIAPDRTIWHVWPGSGKWQEMPNSGLADDMWRCYVNGNGQHQIEVCLDDGRLYYSYNTRQGWRGWYRYDTGPVNCIAGPASKSVRAIR
jgi:hypothetical protein